MTQAKIFTGTLVNTLVDYGVPRDAVQLKSENGSNTLSVISNGKTRGVTFTDDELMASPQLVIDNLTTLVAWYYADNKQNAHWNGSTLVYENRPTEKLLTISALFVLLVSILILCVVKLR